MLTRHFIKIRDFCELAAEKVMLDTKSVLDLKCEWYTGGVALNICLVTFELSVLGPVPVSVTQYSFYFYCLTVFIQQGAV